MTVPAQQHQAAEPRPRKPMLLLFTSGRDGRSRRVEGYLAQVLQRRQNHTTFDVHVVDVDSRPDLVERLRVEQIPTLVVVDQRRVRGRLPSPRGCIDIQELLAPWLR